MEKMIDFQKLQVFIFVFSNALAKGGGVFNKYRKICSERKHTNSKIQIHQYPWGSEISWDCKPLRFLKKIHNGFKIHTQTKRMEHECKLSKNRI